MNWDLPRQGLDLTVTRDRWRDPRITAHEEAGQYWVSKRAEFVNDLRRRLRQLGAEIVDTDYQEPLPELWFLELQYSPDELDRAVFVLLRSLPQEQWWTLIRHLTAMSHPDKPARYRPPATDTLLELALALKDEVR